MLVPLPTIVNEVNFRAQKCKALSLKQTNKQFRFFLLIFDFFFILDLGGFKKDFSLGTMSDL